MKTARWQSAGIINPAQSAKGEERGDRERNPWLAKMQRGDRERNPWLAKMMSLWTGDVKYTHHNKGVLSIFD